jgi:hypothetical protein
MDEKAEAAKRFSAFLESQPNTLPKAFLLELGPDRVVEWLGNALEHLRPLIETAKQIDPSPIWDGRWTRRNIIRAAEEALEDPTMPTGRAESIRQQQALFIEGFDRSVDDKALSPATRAAALMAIRTAFLIGAECPDSEAVQEARAKVKQEQAAMARQALAAKTARQKSETLAAVRAAMEEARVKSTRSEAYARLLQRLVKERLGRDVSVSTVRRCVSAILEERTGK